MIYENYKQLQGKAEQAPGEERHRRRSATTSAARRRPAASPSSAATEAPCGVRRVSAAVSWRGVSRADARPRHSGAHAPHSKRGGADRCGYRSAPDGVRGGPPPRYTGQSKPAREDMLSGARQSRVRYHRDLRRARRARLRLGLLMPSLVQPGDCTHRHQQQHRQDNGHTDAAVAHTSVPVRTVLGPNNHATSDVIGLVRPQMNSHSLCKKQCTWDPGLGKWDDEKRMSVRSWAEFAAVMRTARRVAEAAP